MEKPQLTSVRKVIPFTKGNYFFHFHFLFALLNYFCNSFVIFFILNQKTVKTLVCKSICHFKKTSRYIKSDRRGSIQRQDPVYCLIRGDIVLSKMLNLCQDLHLYLETSKSRCLVVILIRCHHPN